MILQGSICKECTEINFKVCQIPFFLLLVNPMIHCLLLRELSEERLLTKQRNKEYPAINKAGQKWVILKGECRVEGTHSGFLIKKYLPLA